ncbi:MAG: lysine--tRNA ligase [Halanaerobiaceae bacterium]|nr:lysine--tRNA ligase [Halanaerobiaceae bacterium]
MTTEHVEDLNKLMIQRRQKIEEMQKMNIKPYGKKYKTSHHTADIVENFADLEGEQVSLMGRIMALRTHGKASFADLMDMKGRIQLYVKVDMVGEEKYNFFNTLDIGDIIGVSGIVFKTRSGQISIRVEDFRFMSKSLRPLPEKWHGLKDKETRYRQRYVDLIVNPEVKNTFELRSKIIREIRRFLEDRGFLEVETPMMHPIPGGTSARPFITHHNTLDMDLYMRIAPELYLKRLIVGGFEKVFELNRNFRNEGMSYKHNPEFTMMEVYQANADYYDMMELMEEMVAHVAENTLGSTKINYQGKDIDLTPPWRRLTMVEAVKEYTGIDFNQIESDREAVEAARSIGLEVPSNTSKGRVLNNIFEEKVEGNLIQPTFIMNYPIEISPLAAKMEEDPMFTYRFEAFINGWEMCNAFTELIDPIDQKERFEEQVRQRAAGDEEAHMMDEDFVRALEYGIPPTVGLGVGIDRLVMILTDSPSIRDVILFPTMRPEQ